MRRWFAPGDDTEGETVRLGGIEHPLDLLHAVAQARVANAQRKAGVLILYVDENQCPARDGSDQLIAISHGASKSVRLGAAVAW